MLILVILEYGNKKVNLIGGIRDGTTSIRVWRQGVPCRERGVAAIVSPSVSLQKHSDLSARCETRSTTPTLLVLSFGIAFIRCYSNNPIPRYESWLRRDLKIITRQTEGLELYGNVVDEEEAFRVIQFSNSAVKCHTSIGANPQKIGVFEKFIFA